MSTVTLNKPKLDVKILEDATCTFCGCVCDYITLKVEGNRITEAKSACILGKSWFFNQQHEEGPACLIEGEPAAVDDGCERAARILAEAKYPIIYGLADTTSEAQRVAVSIGDWIGGSSTRRPPRATVRRESRFKTLARSPAPWVRSRTEAT